MMNPSGRVESEQIHFIAVNTPSYWVDNNRRHVGLLGVTRSGPLDKRSYRLNCALLNKSNVDTPVLETFGSITFTTTTSLTICVTGANVKITINHIEQKAGYLFTLNPGQTVSVGTPASGQGARVYIGFHAKLHLATVLNSVCNVSREMLTPREQTPLLLKKGLTVGFSDDDTASLNPQHVNSCFATLARRFDVSAFNNTIPMFSGYQYSQLSVNARYQIEQQQFTIDHQSDRMGYRLRSQSPISIKPIAQSQAICRGVIQLPPSGDPIVMLNDKQTHGGYPVIGVVSEIGVQRLAQMSAGDSVKLTIITIEEAISQWQMTLCLDNATLRRVMSA